MTEAFEVAESIAQMMRADSRQLPETLHECVAVARQLMRDQGEAVTWAVADELYQIMRKQ